MAGKKLDGDETVVEKKPKGNMVLVIVIALLVVVLLGGGVAAFFLLGSSHDEATASATPASAHQEAKAPDKKKSKKSTDHLSIGPMFPMTQFVVNLLSESGNRYLKVVVDLELSDAKLIPEMNNKKSLIRDIIIRTFSSKTFEEISTLKGKDKLKDEVLDKINESLSDGQVKNVYFTDFVVQ